uniref:Ubiquitin-like domain-containing protein n=2 Tax=Macrostomum lignano TaxID=282301 RepID=A0A1I8J607_9PLAT
MKCSSCCIDKPSNEYPLEPLTDACHHPLLQICIRCCLKSVDSEGVCPYSQCDGEVEPDSESAAIYRLQLESVVYDYRDKEVSVSQPQVAVSQLVSIPLNLSVSFMSGDTAIISAQSLDSLNAFKLKLQQKMDDRPPVREIKILMGGTSLEGDHRTLAELGIASGCTGLRAIRVLYEVPSDLNKIRFSMSWGWPENNPKNYLDTACITFSKVGGLITHLHNIDFRSTWWQQAYEYHCYQRFIEHCGNATRDDREMRSTSTFNVWVQNLDNLEVRGQPVTHLLFLMSAWRRPNMQGYRMPTLQFFDSARPTQSLYEGTLEFSRFSHYRGLIVCLLKKDRGAWQIVQVARPFTSGDATNYYPIVSDCRRVVEQFG